MQEWHEGLTGSARRIAELDHTPIRVMAGPGTGKTFALMRRVARLLSDGCPPDRILVCTFTRTSALDLASELMTLDAEGATSVHAGTLHSTCFRILSHDDVLGATGRIPRPLMGFEERFLLEDLKEHKLGNISEIRKNLEAYQAAWARLQSESPGTPYSAGDYHFQAQLVHWLKLHKAMLIGELVPITLQYLTDNPLSPFLTCFDHVLVDEYQDLNRAEQQLIDRLASHAKLLIVGDENQSIYSFRYAHPDGISSFAISHASTKDEMLDECWRCPTSIVRLATN